MKLVDNVVVINMMPVLFAGGVPIGCAWMGWQLIPVTIILSSFVGAAIGISIIVIKGRDRNIPIAFGPYLAIAGWIAFFWGDAIMRTYGFHL